MKIILLFLLCVSAHAYAQCAGCPAERNKEDARETATQEKVNEAYAKGFSEGHKEASQKAEHDAKVSEVVDVIDTASDAITGSNGDPSIIEIGIKLHELQKKDE